MKKFNLRSLLLAGALSFFAATAAGQAQIDTNSIEDKAVTNEKLADMPANSLKLRLDTDGTPSDTTISSLPTGSPTNSTILIEAGDGALEKLPIDALPLVTDGDKGDITISSGGWVINSGAIDYSEIANTPDVVVDTKNSQADIEAYGFVAGPHTVDTDTQLTEAEVITHVTNNGFVSGAHTVPHTNGTNCPAGQYNAGVDENGNAENCTLLPTNAEDIVIDASGFNGNLSTSDTDVQELAETLDNLTIASSGGASADTGWIEVGSAGAAPFENDWVDFDTHHSTGLGRTVAYRRIGGVVYLQGVVTNPTGTADKDSVMFTLPSGFRPRARVIVYARNGTTDVTTGTGYPRSYGNILISPDGEVYQAINADHSFVFLDEGIFPADN